MDDGTYSFRMHLGHQMAKVSAHLADISSNPTSHEPHFPRCPPVLEDEWTNAWPPDIPASTHYSQMNAQPDGIYSPFPPAIPARYEAIGMPYHKSLINYPHDEGSSDSESKSQTVFQFIPVSPNSTTQGFEGSLHASVSTDEDQRDIELADVDTNCKGRCQEEYRELHKIFDFVPSNLPIISRAPAVVPHQEQKVSLARDRRNRFYKKGKGPRPAGFSLRSSYQPDGECNALNGRYRCNICGLGYAQLQGLTRHFRETHEASLCTYCNDFKWGRPYRLREHIKKRHPDIDPSVALEEATKTRRRTTINREDSTTFHRQTQRMGLPVC